MFAALAGVPLDLKAVLSGREQVLKFGSVGYRIAFKVRTIVVAIFPPVGTGGCAVESCNIVRSGLALLQALNFRGAVRKRRHGQGLFVELAVPGGVVDPDLVKSAEDPFSKGGIFVKKTAVRFGCQRVPAVFLGLLLEILALL